MKTYSSEQGMDEIKQEVPCNLCGSGQYKPRLLCNGFTFVECLRCGLVYQNPRPRDEDVLSRYGNDYFTYEYENEANFFGLMLLGLNDVDFSGIEAEILSSPDRRKKFLDIGCATGRLLEHVRGRGWQEQGAEVCRESVEYGWSRRNVRIFHGTLEEAAFPDAEFSVVHGSHVIEHVLNPAAFVREIFRILEPGGYALITTPNVEGWQARLFRNSWRSAIGDHMFLFSKAALGSLFSNTGFVTQKIKTWGGLAAGRGPKPLKRLMDKSAKVLGTGDVMMFRCLKPAGP
ncbi:MAG: class I SAM-dependent methyltransferase [Spirochaetales bacterium]|nr:MAG: class I SAM-dependent methyltransferase [Spirochaetales bacterium]